MGLNKIRGGKIIKHIIAKNYEIALYELYNGKYVIGIDTMGSIFICDPILDLALANFMFEQKLRNLEGH